MRRMQDQPGLLSVVLLGRHEYGLMAAQLTALAHEREQTAGRAEPSASIGVQGLPQLAMHDVAFRGAVLNLEGQGGPRGERRRAALGYGRRRGELRGQRQGETEGRACATRAVELDRAAVGGGERPGDGKAEGGA